MQSERIQKFLRFIVEEALAGRGDALKEYTIALDVFDRDESFDPQTNSIVRVEASRLRGKLREYYGVNGRDDPILISLPTGSYVPAFQLADRELPPATESPERTASYYTLTAWHVLIAGAAIAVVAGAVLMVSHFVNRDRDESSSVTAQRDVQVPSIAVLPLRNLSGKREEDYFSDGMTDALITSLAKLRSVRVTSLTSAMVYKNVNRPIAEIARELNVDHVIEGSILRSGERVRITAQLIEAKTDRHLWAESYERDLADVLAIQDDVAQRIAAALPGGAEVVISARPNKRKPVDPAAQEAYLKGRFFRNQMTEEGFFKGISYFKQAVAKEPDFAEALAGMAACYCLLGGHGFELVDPKDGMPTAKEAAMDAIRLDASLAEPHAFVGIIRLKYEWDWPGAEEAFKHAIDLNPSYAQGHVFYSFFLEAMGRQKEAIREANIASQIDPLSLQANVNLGWQYLRAGQLDEALRQFELAEELNPGFWGAHWGIGHYYRRKGDHDRAIASFRKALAVGGGYTLPITDLGYTYAVSGRTAEARAMLDRLMKMAENAYVSSYSVATIHVGLGEIDTAFVWLERAFEERSRSLAWLNVADEYDNLRTDPRFTSLLRRVGLPE